MSPASSNEILSYESAAKGQGRRTLFDAPAVLDLGAVASLATLIATVSIFGAGGSNTMWWAEDWQSLALFSFYRILEALILGLPVSALVIRALRRVKGTNRPGSIWWLGLATVVSFLIWAIFLIDPLDCHI